MNNAAGRLLLPLILLFVLINFSVFFFSTSLVKNNIDVNVLYVGNLLMFVISIISFFIQQKGMYNKNPHVFVRSVMSGMMLKMAVCILAVFAYVYSSGTTYNKRGIFIALFFYLIYLATEVYVIMKMNKNKKADA